MVRAIAPLSPEAEAEAFAAWRDRGDPAALELLVRSHVRLVWRIAAMHVRPWADVDELFAAGLVGFIGGTLRSFDPSHGRLARWTWITLPGDIGRWSARCASIVRRGRSDVSLYEPVTDGDGVGRWIDHLADPSPGPLERIEVAERRLRVRQSLEGLRPREHCVIKRWAEGESLEQIGASLGLCTERIAQMAAAARAKLALALHDEGGA